MSLLQSILLGILQGLTEFLPISSSAHLVIAPYLFNWDIPAQAEFIFDVLVQIGTLLAVLIYFRKDLWEILKAFLSGIFWGRPFADQPARLGWVIILATLPAVVIGFLFKDQVERVFDSPIASALLLLGTAALLFVAEWLGKRTRDLQAVNWKDGLVIGLFQAVSLLPGISRSGSSISGGMLRGLDRPTAARFSFIMSVPALAGAGLLAVLDLVKIPDFLSQVPTLLAGFVTSTVVGYLAIRWFLSFLSRRPLYVFAIYCIALCLTVIIVSLVRA